MTAKMTSRQILDALREWHCPPYRKNGEEVAFFEELRLGTGYGGKNVEQRLDAWVIGLWPHKGLPRVAYEVKCSRSDYLREIADPIKRRRALLVSNRYYFVTPEGMIKPEELPIECGLVEVNWHPNPQRFYRGVEDETKPKEVLRCHIIVEAPHRDNPPPTWAFFAAIARRIAREERMA